MSNILSYEEFAKEMYESEPNAFAIDLPKTADALVLSPNNANYVIDWFIGELGSGDDYVSYSMSKSEDNFTTALMLIVAYNLRHANNYVESILAKVLDLSYRSSGSKRGDVITEFFNSEFSLVFDAESTLDSILAECGSKSYDEKIKVAQEYIGAIGVEVAKCYALTICRYSSVINKNGFLSDILIQISWKYNGEVNSVAMKCLGDLKGLLSRVDSISYVREMEFHDSVFLLYIKLIHEILK